MRNSVEEAWAEIRFLAYCTRLLAVVRCNRIFLSSPVRFLNALAADVLSALATKSKDAWVVPYRNSKLTHLLR